MAYTSVQLTLPAGYGNSLMRKIAEGDDACRSDLLRFLFVAFRSRLVTYSSIIQPEIIRQERLQTYDSGPVLELEKQQR